MPLYNRAMSKRGAFLINGYTLYPGHEHFLKRMKEELANLGVKMDVITSTEAYAHIASSGDKVNVFPDVDFIIVLDKDKYILKSLEAMGLRLFNSSFATELCDDKMLTYLTLSNLGIKMPETISSPLNYSRADETAFLNTVEGTLGYPLVCKTNFGSMGTGVFLLQNKEELHQKALELRDMSHLYQKFIASSFGIDYRLIVIGGKVLTGYRRHGGENEFRSNIGLGGHGEAVTLTNEQIAIAEKAALELGLDYCGIDLLEGENGEPILCEVNSNAFFAGAEKTTGVNIAKAYAAYIVKEFYSQ